ncbi:hypothetical protein E2C01_077419 [Portunus trituberculatus]|uniref:Uncharacterized protein n=1 Tax=Portunus trituberculatus TaxID=210409 RepID=A0A5B7IM27_PORTR|nr:hypothetical protein [Portunus trituberculatus]
MNTEDKRTQRKERPDLLLPVGQQVTAWRRSAGCWPACRTRHSGKENSFLPKNDDCMHFTTDIRDSWLKNVQMIERPCITKPDVVHGGRLELAEDMYFMVSEDGYCECGEGYALTWMSSGVGVLAGVMELG